MKIAVIGATGGVGTHVVRQGLSAGHQVTAVVRNPSRLAVDAQPGLDVVTADVMDPDELGQLLSGRDAVISALGPPTAAPTTVVRDGARSTITAMHASGVRRLLIVSAAAMHTHGDDPFTRFVVKPVLGRILRHPFADMRAAEALIRESALDWTIVAPPRLTDGPATGKVRSSIDRTVRRGYAIRRADVAGFLLRAMTDEDLVHKVVFVAK